MKYQFIDNSLLKAYSLKSILQLIDLMNFLQIEFRYISSVILAACRRQQYGYAGMLAYIEYKSIVSPDEMILLQPFCHKSVEYQHQCEFKQYQLIIEKILPLLQNIDEVNKYCQSKADPLINSLNKGVPFQNYGSINESHNVKWWFGIINFEEFIFWKRVINKYQLTFDDYKQGTRSVGNPYYVEMKYLQFGNAKIDQMINDLLTSPTSINIPQTIYYCYVNSDNFVAKLPRYPDMYLEN